MIVNCSGVGAHDLARDPDVHPIKGQLLRVSIRMPLMAFSELHLHTKHSLVRSVVITGFTGL